MNDPDNPIPASARPIEGEIKDTPAQAAAAQASAEEVAANHENASPDAPEPVEEVMTAQTGGTTHDAATGEVVDEAEAVQPARRVAQVERAADGAVMTPIAVSGGNALDLLEDGMLSADFYDQLQELGWKMAHINDATGQKAKGRITLVLDLEKEGEAFGITGKTTVKAPEMPRPKSVMWQTESGEFSRFPPNQSQLFGTRSTAVRNI